ncbi:hypothetical protein H0H92_008912 [Tricholoma furcatifolium]|nr:hypothetical protein H0H92_008912 [Tricholoma furcatifolium]
MIQTAHHQRKSKLAGSWTLPDGIPKKKANDYMTEIAAEWKQLSAEERLARTEEKVSELRDIREMRNLAPQNVPIASFHDVWATLDSVDEELTMKENPLDISVRMEAYMLSRVQEQATKSPVARMYYSNFESHITAKHGVIIKNWPLTKFCSPSDVQSRIELNILLNAWKSDTCHFYRMTRDEFDAWEVLQVAGDRVGPSSSSNPLPMARNDSSDDSLAMPQSITPPHFPDAPPVSAGPAAPFASIANSGSNSAGNVVFVTKRPRKVRKDKGMKRRKAASTENVDN